MTKTASTSVPLRTRLYVWSVIFEPLFFFVLFGEAAIGVTGSLSRLLQMLTCLVVVGRLGLTILPKCRQGPWTVPDPRRPLYRNFALMFLLAVAAGFIGFASGAYEVPSAYQGFVGRSSFSSLLNSATVRPVFEYVAVVYYFGYFAVLARYLLTTTADVDYALIRFKGMFVISLVVGAIDLAFSMPLFPLQRVYLVPRHLSDWSPVGPQFHGLAGEPRQAFVYLFLGLAILHLSAFREGRRLSRWWLAIVVIAAALTQSMTGLVAIVMFLGLYALAAIPELSLVRLFRLAAGFALVAVVTYGVAINSKRTMDYFHAASDLWHVLETNQELSYLMSKSNSDIYPLYDLTVKARAGEWLPVVAGSGLGSASAVANRYYRVTSELNNPHSQLARSLYETGLLGTFLYVMVFLGPVRWMVKGLSRRIQREFMMLTLLVVACSLADRSAAPFVYLGWVAAVFRVNRRDQGVILSPGVSPSSVASGS